MRSPRFSLLVVACAVALIACGNDGDAEQDGASSKLAVPVGIWQTQISGAELNEELSVPESYGGRWILDITEGGYQIRNEVFGRVSGEIEATADSLHLLDPPAPIGAFNCYDDEGNRITTEDYQVGVYTYTEDGDRLAFVTDDEPCPFREFFVEREWTKSG